MWEELKPRVWGPMNKVWENPDFGVPYVEGEGEEVTPEVMEERILSLNGDSNEPVPELVEV
jgi:hypothetical protein